MGTFPDGNAALVLACARLRHAAGTQWGIAGYAAWLKIAPDNIQLKARTLPADTADYVKRMKQYTEQEEDESCWEMIEDNIAEIGQGVFDMTAAVHGIYGE